MQLGKEKEALFARQFSLDKIKDDSATMLFYTGFRENIILERRETLEGKSALSDG